MEPGDVTNEVSGDVGGHVVQAGAIYGDVHLGPDTTRQAQLRLREYLQSLGQADDKHEYAPCEAWPQGVVCRPNPGSRWPSCCCRSTAVAGRNSFGPWSNTAPLPPMSASRRSSCSGSAGLMSRSGPSMAS